MPNPVKNLFVIGAMLAVSACGSTTTSTFVDNTPTFTRDLLAFSTASTDRRNDPLSGASAVTNATGTYTGQAQVAVLGGGPTATYLGTANLTANIATGRVSGNLTGFKGGVDQSAPETMTGSIKVAGETIGGNGASSFTSGMAGQLNGPSTAIVLGSGTLNGTFRNSPTDGLFATGTANGTTVNGISGRSAIVNVIADKQ